MPCERSGAWSSETGRKRLVACHMSYSTFNVLLRKSQCQANAGDSSPPQTEASTEANRRLEKMPQQVELQQRLTWIRLVNGRGYGDAPSRQEGPSTWTWTWAGEIKAHTPSRKSWSTAGEMGGLAACPGVTSNRGGARTLCSSTTTCTYWCCYSPDSYLCVCTSHEQEKRMEWTVERFNFSFGFSFVVSFAAPSDHVHACASWARSVWRSDPR
ncbi:hypothetical protein V8C26DRAFT_240760 [Trichoderma gracile]